MLHIRLTFIGIKTGWAPKQLSPWKILFGSPAGPWRKNVKLCPWLRGSITCVLLYIYWHVACNIIQNIYRKHHVINCLFLNILYSNCQQCRCSCFYILGLKPILFLLNVNLFKSDLPFCIHLCYIVLKFIVIFRNIVNYNSDPFLFCVWKGHVIIGPHFDLAAQ